MHRVENVEFLIFGPLVLLKLIIVNAYDRSLQRKEYAYQLMFTANFALLY